MHALCTIYIYNANKQARIEALAGTDACFISGMLDGFRKLMKKLLRLAIKVDGRLGQGLYSYIGIIGIALDLDVCQERRGIGGLAWMQWIRQHARHRRQDGGPRARPSKVRALKSLRAHA
jgi:hypothetical protein